MLSYSLNSWFKEVKDLSPMIITLKSKVFNLVGSCEAYLLSLNYSNDIENSLSFDFKLDELLS